MTLPVLYSILAFLLGYLSGSVPYGLLLGKFFGLGDIRKSGSGNIGATNALRVGGKKLAILTLLCDALKGTIPVLIAKHFSVDLACLAAGGAFFGHLFPVWLKFKGGKGVATGLGIAFAFSLQLGLTLCLIWLFVAILSKYSSLSALTAFSAAPPLSFFFLADAKVMLVMSLISILIFITHRQNISRLVKGEESKIKLKKQ